MDIVDAISKNEVLAVQHKRVVTNLTVIEVRVHYLSYVVLILG